MYCPACSEKMELTQPAPESSLIGKGTLHGCDFCDFLYLEENGDPLTITLLERKLSSYRANSKADHDASHKPDSLSCPKCGAIMPLLHSDLIPEGFRDNPHPMCRHCDLLFLQSNRKWISLRAYKFSLKTYLEIHVPYAELLRELKNKMAEENRKKREEEDRKRLEELEKNDPDLSINRGARYWRGPNQCGICGKEFQDREEIRVKESANRGFCKKCGVETGASDIRRYSY